MAWKEIDKTWKSYGAARKKAEDAAWIQRRESGGVYVKSTGKRNAELEQIPNLGSDTFPKLLQSVSLFQRLGASPQMAADRKSVV